MRSVRAEFLTEFSLRYLAATSSAVPSKTRPFLANGQLHSREDIFPQNNLELIEDNYCYVSQYGYFDWNERLMFRHFIREFMLSNYVLKSWLRGTIAFMTVLVTALTTTFMGENRKTQCEIIDGILFGRSARCTSTRIGTRSNKN